MDRMLCFIGDSITVQKDGYRCALEASLKRTALVDFSSFANVSLAGSTSLDLLFILALAPALSATSHALVCFSAGDWNKLRAGAERDLDAALRDMEQSLGHGLRHLLSTGCRVADVLPLVSAKGEEVALDER